MQCLVCRNYKLSDTVKIGDLVIHSCPNCRGLRFKNNGLRKAKDIKLPDKDKSKFSFKFNNEKSNNL